MLPQAVRDWLDPLYTQSLAAVPDGPAKTAGIAIGEAAASAMLAERADDGRFGTFQFTEGFDPGEWRLGPPQGPTGIVARDPAAWVGDVTPFLVPNVEMLRTDGPNPVTSAAYAEDFNEVKELGSLTSTTRTADQTAAAVFWQDGTIWNGVLRSLTTSEDLDIADSARLLAEANLAGADGSIGCWNDKAYWSFWRPITAIREAGSDGNPATEADAAWLPLFNPTIPVSGAPLVTPGFPDHPSGHTCISGAIARTLKAFFGTDKIGVHGGEPQVLSCALPAEELQPVLGRAQGDHRRPRLGRHPLPDRRRAGKRAGQEGRPLSAGAVPGPVTNRAARRPRHQPGGARRRSRSARRSTRRRRARGAGRTHRSFRSEVAFLAGYSTSARRLRGAVRDVDLSGGG